MRPILGATTALLLARCGASPLAALEERQSCPNIHIFGARETTARAGYGTAGVVVNLILNAYPGSTAEAIVYPACGGQASCGGASYSSSASQGATAVASAVNAYVAKCPNTQIVLVGYSQGGEIIDTAFCGGGDSPQGIAASSANTINAAGLNAVEAVIEMGSPRFVAGSSYDAGTCAAQGFSARPAGYNCPSACRLRSYCDAADPYCCTGSDASVHQEYGTEYGQQALAFVETKLTTSGSGSSTPTTTAAGGRSTPPASGGSVAHYGQCGGFGYTGSTACASPYTCKVVSQYYSQCQ